MLGTHTYVGLPTSSYARIIIRYHATLPSVSCIVEQVPLNLSGLLVQCLQNLL